MDEIKLKPCPVCGGKPAAMWNGAFDKDNFWVRCWECGAATSIYESEKEAKEAWNRRANMSKAVLISIRPEWVEKILNGEKTLEVRRNRPKLETPFKCYIYCTNSGVAMGMRGKHGKVVAEFVCDNIATYNYDYCPHPEIGMDYNCGDSWWEIADEDLKSACLTEKEFRYYAFGREEMYGWHISDLKIYGKPKKLSKFIRLEIKKFWVSEEPIARPPQSWCYVEELK